MLTKSIKCILGLLIITSLSLCADSVFADYDPLSLGCMNGQELDPGAELTRNDNPSGGGFTGSIEVRPEDDVIGGTGTPMEIFEKIVVNVMNFLFLLGFIIVPILVVIGGFMYMTARGDSVKAQKAKTLIFWSLLGLAILACGKIILAIVKYILQIE